MGGKRHKTENPFNQGKSQLFYRSQLTKFKVWFHSRSFPDAKKIHLVNTEKVFSTTNALVSLLIQNEQAMVQCTSLFSTSDRCWYILRSNWYIVAILPVHFRSTNHYTQLLISELCVWVNCAKP